MEYLQLYYFVCVAREQNFSRAANKVMVSQPSLSRSIQHLENEFGVRLINRTTRNFQLTQAGQELLAEGEKLIRDFENLEAYMKNYSLVDKGDVRVGIPSILNTIMAPIFVTNFSKSHPNINLLFSVKGSKLIQEDVAKNECDLGLIIRPVDEQRFQTYEIMSNRLALFVSPGHRLANASAITIEDLRNESLLLLDSSYQLHDNVVTACIAAGFKPNINHLSPNWDYLIELIALGQGVTILPSPFKNFMRSEIVEIPIIGDWAKWDVVAITSIQKYTPSNVKTLIRYMYDYYHSML